MSIGIIGAGALGSNVARLLARSGISAAIANSRGPASLAGLAQELGPSIKAGTVREAASADIVLVAVRWVDLGKALIHWIGVAPSGPLSRRASGRVTMLYAEDLAVGQRFELGSYSISEEELSALQNCTIPSLYTPIRRWLLGGRSAASSRAALTLWRSTSD